MEDAEVKLEYGDFTAGVNTITKLNSELETQKSEIENCKSELENEAIFMGPAAESIKETLFEISGLVNLMTENFTVMGKLLTQIGNNFKAADDAAIKVIAATKDGKYEIISQDSENNMFINSLKADLGNRIDDYSNFNYEAWCEDWVSLKLKENGYKYDWATVAGDENTHKSIIKVMKDGGAKVHFGEYAVNYGKTPDSSYIPQAGDVFVTNVDDEVGIDHTGFIIKDNGDGTVTTIEGNTYTTNPDDYDGGVVQIHTDRKKSEIYAYATPSK